MTKPRASNTVQDIANFVAHGHSQSAANCRVLLDEIERLRGELKRHGLASRPEAAGRSGIYVITVLTTLRPRPIVVPGRYGAPARIDEIAHRDSRSWGWYATLAEAEDALAHNVTDMHEGLYDIAVLERVPAGVLAFAQQESWWRFDPAANAGAGGYTRAERPDDLDNVLNFALG